MGEDKLEEHQAGAKYGVWYAKEDVEEQLGLLRSEIAKLTGERDAWRDTARRLATTCDRFVELIAKEVSDE